MFCIDLWTLILNESRGLEDKASAPKTEGCGFESHVGKNISFCNFLLLCVPCSSFAYANEIKHDIHPR